MGEQACLNAPEPTTESTNGVDADGGLDSPEDSHPVVAPPPQGRMAANPTGMGQPPQQYMTPEQHMQYQQYLQQQQGQYAGMPPQGRMPTHAAHQ
jgi:pheromone receptor transcription factor